MKTVMAALYVFVVAAGLPMLILFRLNWMTPVGVFVLFQSTAALMLPLLWWYRENYTPAQLRQLMVFLLAAPLMLGGFGLPFYVFLEKLGWKGPGGQIAAAVVGLTWIGLCLWLIQRFFPAGLSGGSRHDEKRWQQEQEQRRREFEREKAKLIDRLQADPRLRRFVPAAEKHEIWSVEEAEYLLDPSQTATCPHLRTVEAAMRAAGIFTRRPYESMGRATKLQVYARAIIDEAALRARYPLAPSVKYVAWFNEWEDRGPRSDSRLHCQTCNSNLSTVHPEEAGPGTPTFPVPAAHSEKNP